MDRGLYVAMTGAKQIMQAQAVNNHNIANINTVGFRADAVSFVSQPIYGPGYATRVNAVASDAGTDFSSGVMQGTGRDLDIAVNGNGYIAVMGSDGTEGYTRAGDLRVGVDGSVTTAAGQAVLTESAIDPNAEAKYDAANHSLVLFDRGDEIVVQAGPEGIRFLLVSGKPLEEPVAWYGPIVMNTQAELQQAMQELQSGKFIKHQ